MLPLFFFFLFLSAVLVRCLVGCPEREKGKNWYCTVHDISRLGRVRRKGRGRQICVTWSQRSQRKAAVTSEFQGPDDGVFSLRCNTGETAKITYVFHICYASTTLNPLEYVSFNSYKVFWVLEGLGRAEGEIQAFDLADGKELWISLTNGEPAWVLLIQIVLGDVSCTRLCNLQIHIPM